VLLESCRAQLRAHVADIAAVVASVQSDVDRPFLAIKTCQSMLTQIPVNLVDTGISCLTVLSFVVELSKVRNDYMQRRMFLDHKVKRVFYKLMVRNV